MIKLEKILLMWLLLSFKNKVGHHKKTAHKKLGFREDRDQRLQGVRSKKTLR